jgi:hypothetical protein
MDAPEKPITERKKSAKKRGPEAGKYSLRKLPKTKKKVAGNRSVSDPTPKSQGKLVVELKSCTRSRRSLG